MDNDATAGAFGTSEDRTAVILGGARTPFGWFRGSLAPLSSSELGAHAIRNALERTGVAPG
jgi:acetyl-CoA C-acetyltransferase